MTDLDQANWYVTNRQYETRESVYKLAKKKEKEAKKRGDKPDKLVRSSQIRCEFIKVGGIEIY